jgi:hypothetical protein
VDPGWARSALPAGFAPDAPILATQWEACDSAVLDNATVLRDVRLVLTNLRLTQAPDPAPDGEDAYTLEAYSSSPELALWLRERGFEAEEAQVGLPSGTPGAATLEAPGVSYRFSAAPEPRGTVNSVEGLSRRHHVTAGGAAWADVTPRLGHGLSPAVLAGEAAGGAAGHAAVPGAVAGIASYASSGYLYVFHKGTTP